MKTRFFFVYLKMNIKEYYRILQKKYNECLFESEASNTLILNSETQKLIAQSRDADFLFFLSEISAKFFLNANLDIVLENEFDEKEFFELRKYYYELR